MARQEQLKLEESWAAAAGASARVEPWRRGIVLLAVVALVAVCAQLAVPLPGTPVPVTLQDLAVMGIGVVLGPVQGALGVALYVMIGALGAPIFANGGSGLATLMGPTGGYLIAFPIVAFLIGHATARGRPLWLIPVGLLAAQVVMFAGGVTQLALVTGRPVGDAVALGLVPFLPGVAFKSVVLIVFALAYGRWRRGATD